MKLIQYAHWERDRFKAEATPPPALKLDLSDNCIAEPAALIEELKTKRIRLCPADSVEEGSTVHVVDFTDQRPPLPPNCPPGVAKLIEVTWLQDAAGRPTIAQTLGFVQTRLGV